MISISISLKINVRDDVTGDDILTNLLVASGSDVISLDYINNINQRISGKFRISEVNNALLSRLRLQSDVEGRIILSDSRFSVNDYDSDNNRDSFIDIVILNWEEVRAHESITIIEFEFEGGRFMDDITGSQVFQGNSIEAIQKLLQIRGAKYELGSTTLSRLSGTEVDELEPTDAPNMTGGWYNFSQNMFDGLNYIIDHSLKYGDYLFWVYDDINSQYKISSILEQYSATDRYIYHWTLNAPIDSVIKITNKDYSVIAPSSYTKSSNIGTKYEFIFPNNSYTLGFDTSITKSSIDFKQYLKSVTGKTINISAGNSVEFSDINEFGPVTYGPGKTKQMSNLNTHMLHGFADDYRNFKMATFSKKITAYLSNSFGPSVGEYVTFLTHNISELNQGNMELDKYYSDRYFITGKRFSYNSSDGTYVAEMSLVSDNTSGELPQDVMDIYNEIKGIRNV